MKLRSVRLCCGLAMLLCACDDGTGFVEVDDIPDRLLPGDPDAGGAGRSGDGGAAGDGAGPAMDAAIIMLPDGATFDAAALGHDGSVTLPVGAYILEDGAVVLPDGEVIDRETAIDRYDTPEPNVPSCELASEDGLEIEVELGDEGGYALVPGATGFGLAYQALAKPGGNCDKTIDVMHIPGGAGFPEPLAPLPSCGSTLSDVTLAAQGEGWQLAWVDNYPGSAELSSLALGADMRMAEGASRRQLTDDSDALERRPVIKEVHGRPLVAFIAKNGSEYTISTQWLDDESPANAVIVPADEHQPQGLALSAIGETRSAVAWTGPETNPGVWIQPLDEEGARFGDPIKLTDRVAASSSVDLAQRDDGGAVIYSIEIDGQPQVRFRRLDPEGLPVGDERIIIGAPLRAQSASIYALAGGYAVTYRALPSGSVAKPEIRLLFISKEGNLMRDGAGSLPTISIAEATLASARTTVVVSVDGRIMVAWVDASSANNNALKVRRHRLECNR